MKPPGSYLLESSGYPETIINFPHGHTESGSGIRAVVDSNVFQDNDLVCTSRYGTTNRPWQEATNEIQANHS